MVLEQRKLWLSLTAQSPVLEFLCPPQKHPASLVLPTSVPAFGDICPTLCWELPVMQAGVILEMRLPKTAWKTLSDVMFLLLLLLSTHLWKKKIVPVITLAASNRAWQVCQSYYLRVTVAKNIKTSVLTDRNRNDGSRQHIPVNQVGSFQS